MTMLLVVGCPVLCHTGYCATSTTSELQESRKPCCAHCAAYAAANDDRDKDRPQIPDDCGLHCLCQGAVLDHETPQLDGAQLFESPAVEILAPANAGGQHDATAIPPDNLMPSGLRARIALCSLLR